MSSISSTREQVALIGAHFLQELRRILGEKLHAAVIFGAAAFPDDVPTGDVDFHVILLDALTAEEKASLEAMHTAMADAFPPLGAEMDGYYLLLEDARGSTPPKSQLWACATDEAWALHRAHIHAGRCLLLHGPDLTTIYALPSRLEIEEALAHEMHYVEAHATLYPDYAFLQLCRLIYSHETGEVVVSKAEAASWGEIALPAWRQHFMLARKSYAREGTPEERQFMIDEIGAFLDFARKRITAHHYQ